jgi:hypothetical protein
MLIGSRINVCNGSIKLNMGNQLHNPCLPMMRAYRKTIRYKLPIRFVVCGSNMMKKQTSTINRYYLINNEIYPREHLIKRKSITTSQYKARYMQHVCLVNAEYRETGTWNKDIWFKKDIVKR